MEGCAGDDVDGDGDGGDDDDDDAWKVAQVPTEESFHPIWLPLAAALNQTTPPISSPFHFDNFHFDNFHLDFMPSSCDNCMMSLK